jgi:hypothetical protein
VPFFAHRIKPALSDGIIENLLASGGVLKQNSQELSGEFLVCRFYNFLVTHKASIESALVSDAKVAIGLDSFCTPNLLKTTDAKILLP